MFSHILLPGRLFVLASLFTTLAAGCGGDPVSTPSSPTAKPRPDTTRSTVEVSRASGVLANGEDGVTLTITVREKDSSPLPEAVVNLEVSGEGNTLTPASGRTDARGVMSAVLVSTGAGTKQVTVSVEVEGGEVVLEGRPTVEFVAAHGDPCSKMTCTPPPGTCTADETSVVSHASSCVLEKEVGVCRHTPTTTRCPAGDTCSAGACIPVTPEHQAGRILISEFSSLGSEFIELHNPSAADIDIRGFTLANRAAQLADIRALSDPEGTARTPVVVPAGGFLVGVANPSGPLPAGVGFIYGPPGTGFSLADTGDALALYSFPGGRLEDAVDFRVLVTHPDLPLAANAFVAFPGRSTQVDPKSLTAAANDIATHWCVSFHPAGARGPRVSNTAGAANGSCGVAVINEVLIGNTGADGSGAFLEIAGPGGSLIGGARILDVEGMRGGAGTLNADGDFGPGETDGEFVIPAGTRIPADGILLIADSSSSDTTQVPHFVPGVDVMARDMDLETGGGDAILLVSSSNTLLDAVGHSLEGADLDASTDRNGLVMYEGATALYPPVGASLMRSADSSDTDWNRNDFRADPTPTPGLPNDLVSFTVSGMTPDDAHASVGEGNITVTGTDLASGLMARFGSNVTLGCIVTSATSAMCSAPGNMNVVSVVDVTFTNPESVGVAPVVLTHAFTYTGTQNGTNSSAEADLCELQRPSTLTVQQSQMTGPIRGRLHEVGVTDVAPGAPSGVMAEVGYGSVSTDPTSSSSWRFFPAAFAEKVSDGAEFTAALQAPPVMWTTLFSYTYRFSFDKGLNWTYCDLNGAGSAAGLGFEPDQLGVMTVNP